MGSMTNHLTPFLIHFFRGMGLLTREEEKRFPRERESFTEESSEGTEDENPSPAILTHTTAQGPVQVDVVPRHEQPERRMAKKRKVVSDDEEELAHTVRRVDMEVSGARQHRARARPKKRAKRRMVTVEVSDSSVEKTVAPLVNTSEVANSEVMRSVELGVPSEASIEDPADIPAEPLNEGTELVSPISLSSERTRSAQGEGTPQMKMNEDLEKEFTLSEEILEQVVARVGGTVVEAEGTTLPTSPVEEVRPEEGKKTSGEDVKTLEVTFLEFLQDSVEPLLKYLDGKRKKYVVSKEPGFYVQMIRNRTLCRLEETCGGLRTSNENAQKVTVDLMSRVEKSREAYDAAVKRAERLIATTEKQEKKHIEDLATLEVRRAEEARIAEELWGKLAASLSAGNLKHEDELKDWAKKLADCESAKSSRLTRSNKTSRWH
ncbi:hypothetical protein AXG93_4525s1140 [Marchantia polymorpha subsp. ruderalis]|uniref:Uncharacterized protein n=1 Tax=Marchantia polymorpha subsp. ruderalis TaxID=1480154 RepID=A0A176WHY3_MARPO|nr:hypothetical protein AXG93_4525s1140 [Marchantia polymorpha subsp. ruderalis]